MSAKITAYLLAIVLPWSRSDTVWAFYVIVAYATFIVILTTLVQKKTMRIIRPLIWFGLLTLWIGASSFWTVNEALTTSMTIRVAITMFVLMIYHQLDQMHGVTPFFIKGLHAGIYLNFFLLFVPLGAYTFDSTGRYHGLTHNANIISMYVALSVFILTVSARHKKIRLWRELIILLPALGVILETGSRKGLIVAILSYSVAVLLNTRRPVRSTMTIILLAGSPVTALTILYTTGLGLGWIGETGQRLDEAVSFFFMGGDGDSSTRWRSYFMAEGIRLFFANPLTGIGADAFQSIFGYISHSNHIELLATTGIVGYSLYYAGYVSYARQLRQMNSTTNFYAMMVILAIVEFATVVYYERYYLIMVMVMFYYLPKYLAIDEMYSESRSNNARSVYHQWPSYRKISGVLRF